MQATRYIVVVKREGEWDTYADSVWDFSITDMTRARLYVRHATAERLANKITNGYWTAVVKPVNVVVEYK